MESDSSCTHAQINSILRSIQDEAPLVHHITNWVTIYECAQITRCSGALPVMAHMQAEVADMVRMAGALVLNIGTLSPEVMASMEVAGRSANAHGIPIVLDMVGAGATSARTAAVQRLLQALQFAIVKGNHGEVGAACGVKAVVKGVESISVQGELDQLAHRLARQTGAVVVATGPTDVIADSQRLYHCHAGHPLMGKVVGTGCMAASILGAFAASGTALYKAAVCAMEFLGQTGQAAAKKAATPMAFKQRWLDSIYEKAQRAVENRCAE